MRHQQAALAGLLLEGGFVDRFDLRHPAVVASVRSWLRPGAAQQACWPSVMKLSFRE